MAERYEIITEWHGERRRYRIYDKQSDLLLAWYASWPAACAASDALNAADERARDRVDGPRSG